MSRMWKNNHKHKRICLKAPLALIALCVLLLSVIMVANAKKSKPVDDKICDGIYVNDINLSGMTKDEAYLAVNEYINGLIGRRVTINVDGEKVKTSLKKLGFTCEENDFIEEAYQLGKVGNIIKRFKDRKDVERQNIKYELKFIIDEEKLHDFVENECKEFNIEAVNATLKRKNGGFVITEDQVGRLVQVEETVDLLMEKIFDFNEVKNISVKAVVVEDKPKYTSDSLKLCNKKLGYFATNVAGTSNRKYNVSHATSFIDGSVVYPGETFSVADTIYPLSDSNGYREASSYMEGQVVDSLGGGVCQVSTTLYNALLRAELEITERQPHSMIVGYVKPAMDAAIAGDYKDLKFKNNTDTPVYIEGYMSSDVLTFNIYGHETRDPNRKVTFESEVLEKINPGSDVIKKDGSLPETYYKVTQAAHVGYRANLWKIVTVNGKQVSKEKVNYSTYKASPRYITVGTKKVKSKADNDDKNNKSKSTPKPKATSKPKANATPKPNSNENKVTPAPTPPPAENTPLEETPQ